MQEKRSRLIDDLHEVEAAKQKRLAQAAAAKSPRESQSPRMFENNNNSNTVVNDAMQLVSETDREPSNEIDTEPNQSQGSNTQVDRSDYDAVFGDDDDDEDDDANDNGDVGNDVDDDDAIFRSDKIGSGKRKIVDSDDDDTSASPKRQKK